MAHGLGGLLLPIRGLRILLRGFRHVWEGGACLGGVWAGVMRPPRQRPSRVLGFDAHMCPPMDLSPEGQPGPGIVQALQRAQVVGQRVLGIAGQDGKDHGGQRRLLNTRSPELRPQQEQRR